VTARRGRFARPRDVVGASDAGLHERQHPASKRLAQRLTRRGEEITGLLTARLRLLFRIGAYALVVALSISSLVGMISRGLPGMPTLPGGEMSPDQKELEDIMKQLGQ
jgi:hypothetical protein